MGEVRGLPGDAVNTAMAVVMDGRDATFESAFACAQEHAVKLAGEWRPRVFRQATGTWAVRLQPIERVARG